MLRRLLVRGGRFEHGEVSDRSSRLSALWQERWPGCAPLPGGSWAPAGAQYGARWVRFHTLPESKRYADSEDESAEILRRHQVLLSDLIAMSGADELVVVAVDWDGTDLAAGWTKRVLPGRWPWMTWTSPDPDPRDQVLSYFWAASSKLGDLSSLLGEVAESGGRVWILDAELSWAYLPYDGGADVYAPTATAATALRAQRSGWLSTHPSGL